MSEIGGNVGNNSSPVTGDVGRLGVTAAPELERIVEGVSDEVIISANENLMTNDAAMELLSAVKYETEGIGTVWSCVYDLNN